MNEVGIALCVGLGFFSIPIVALVLALVAKARANRAGRALEELTSEVAQLRRALDAQGKMLASLRQKAGPAQAPVEATPASPPSPTAAAATPSEAAPAGPDASTEAVAAVEVPGAPGFGVARNGAPAATPAVESLPAVASSPAALRVETPPEKPSAPPPETVATAPATPPAPERTIPVTAPPPRPVAPPPTHPPAPKKAASGGWERKLGILVPVWVGAIALALSGAYLVKYSVEHGMLGPEMRVLLGTLLGFGLLVAGELARKRYSVTGQGASAAGIAVLYAIFLAASVLYKLVPPWAGFFLVGLTTAVAVALSLRQGVIVATVGLLGGFFTPYFIGIASASPGRFFAYLLCLQGGLLVVTKKRQWTGLSALTLLLVMGAAYHRVGLPTAVNDAPWIGLLVLCSAAGFVLAARTVKARGTNLPGPPPSSWQLPLGYISLVAAMVALMGLAVRTEFGLLEWGFLGLLSAASLVLGRFGVGYSRLPWVAMVLTGILLTGWASFHDDSDFGSIALVAALFGALWALGGWLCHLGSESPGEWGWLAAAGGLWGFGAAYLAGYAGTGGMADAVPWGLICIGLAFIYLAAAVYGALPSRRATYGESQLAAFCTAVSAFATLAVPLELDRHWISVAWALQAAALAWLLTRIRSQALGVISIALAAGVAVRLLLNPEVLTYPVGTVPVLNWFLYGYGIPVVAFAAAARWMERARWKPAAAAFWWGAGALLFALATLEVRHGFHTENLQRGDLGMAETGTYTLAWMALAAGFLWAAIRWTRSTFAHIGLAVAAVAAIKFVLLDLLVLNPLWNNISAGDLPLVNGILYAYGLPVLALALAMVLARSGPATSEVVDAGFRCLIFLALFAFVTLEIRHWFHSPFLDRGASGFLELCTYSHAWFLLAGGILVAWKRWGAPLDLRGAQAFFLLACLKVLFVDAVALNPLHWHREVGPTPVFNGVLYGYGVPIVLLWVLLGMSDRNEWRGLAGPVAAFGSLLLGFVLVSLEVRQYFQGTFLDGGPMGSSENYAYSAAWIVFSLVLLALGIARGGKVPRIASLIVMFLAVGKVFIYDLRHLKDLYRVGSLLGLGISLLLISFIYQRFVFRGQGHDEEP